jgi:hypothetical protein
VGACDIQEGGQEVSLAQRVPGEQVLFSTLEKLEIRLTVLTSRPVATPKPL